MEEPGAVLSRPREPTTGYVPEDTLESYCYLQIAKWLAVTRFYYKALLSTREHPNHESYISTTNKLLIYRENEIVNNYFLGHGPLAMMYGWWNGTGSNENFDPESVA
jgi:hypothetical protein